MAVERASLLEEAQEQPPLHPAIKRLRALDLLVVDELGYLPFTERAADLPFQAFSAHHEQSRVIVNANLPFFDWAPVFKSGRLAVALPDRLTHRARILEMKGESYRLRDAGRRKKPGKTPDYATEIPVDSPPRSIRTPECVGGQAHSGKASLRPRWVRFGLPGGSGWLWCAPASARWRGVGTFLALPAWLAPS
ncbi:MAG: ATP-binding protein [Acidobacteriota bacterium]|nr:ATP-binding protein [Acidobacteriota bacterium]